MSERQRERLYCHQQTVAASQAEKIQRTIRDIKKRNVTPLVKLKVAGLDKADVDSSVRAVITLWRPSEVLPLLSEGAAYMVYNLTVSGRGNTVSLSNNRSTQIERLRAEDYLTELVYEPRQVRTESCLYHSDCLGGHPSLVFLRAHISRE